MKSKLKARFLPPIHFRNNYSQLQHLTPTLPTFYEGCMLTHKVKHQMETEPLKRELTKPLPKEQPSNKGSPSYPPKPATSPTSVPQEDHAPQNSHPPQNEPSPDLITPKSCFKCQDLDHIALECRNGNITSSAECEDNMEEEENLEVCMMEEQDEIVENVSEGELLVLRKALPEPKEPLKDGGVLPPLPEPTPKPYFENHKLENLRANSFLEGENDANMGTLLDQSKSNPSDQESKDLNQESKSLNQASKAKNGLFKAP